MRRAAVFLICLVGLIAIVTYHFNLRINLTRSMPLGLWRMLPPPAQPQRGTIVVSCIGDAETARMALQRGYIGPGHCPAGTEPLLKVVAAVEGDLVDVEDDGITVNGLPVPNTARLAHDPAGRTLPVLDTGTYRVLPGRVWLLATSNPLSFDSRYYGAVRIVDIEGTAVPVVTASDRLQDTRAAGRQ